jgi:hypothetical protein
LISKRSSLLLDALCIVIFAYGSVDEFSAVPRNGYKIAEEIMMLMALAVLLFAIPASLNRILSSRLSTSPNWG